MTEKPRVTIALCGNPNCGKTTLFNLLTGDNQQVGNWPGVTVERKTGRYVKDDTVTIADTPGAYSLSPYALDEQITADYLREQHPDVIINVVDSVNLERNLLLTTQLLEMDCAVVVALNMADEAEKLGIEINADILQQKFGCKFFKISATKNAGVDELMNYCSIKPKKRRKPISFNLESDRSVQIAERYRYIKEALRYAVKKKTRDGKQSLTEKIDKIVLNKWLAFPVFFAVMFVIFYLSIDSVGKLLASGINDVLTPLFKNAVTKLLARAESPWLTSLAVDGVISGVMSVIGFLPQVMILFGLIAALEASGYMARVAFITDRLLSRIGLGGRSFVAIILGCGCSVPAITSCRVIKDIRERNATIALTPFTPCSAKLAVISFFTARILNGNAMIAVSFYLVSIAAIIVGGLALKLLSRKRNKYGDAFVMELPAYRKPSAANVGRQMWERGKAFLLKAGTVILASSVVLWTLTNFDFRFQLSDVADSMLAQIGKFVSSVFTPLGFDDGGCGWQYTVAAISGVVAKETVITTLEILLPAGIEHTISPLGAYCFVVYNILTIPCIGAISASFAEQGNWKNGVKTMIFQLAVSYAVTLAIYQTGRLVTARPSAAIIAVTLFTLGCAVVLSVRYLVRRKRCNGVCSNCQHNCK